jgi:hypothetical protein
MKITKAKLKQIISEELSSMSEGGAQGHYEGGAGAVDELWDHLQGMLTVPSNEVPMSRM